ncbi:MAG TPA: cation:proton antiporter [Burkholderiales bacterium]|nr:cation:proton antiporter [Burkholderiales bacterium]
MFVGASFLPQDNFSLNNLLLFGILLLAGLLSGHLFSTSLRVPRIVGFVAVGILLGPAGLNWISEGLLADAQVFVDIGLGLVLYELGNRLDLKWLMRDKWLLATGVAESALAFSCVYLALYLLDVRPLTAALLGALAISTSPAVVTQLTKELRAEGRVTELALSFTALNNVIAFFVITMLLPAIHLQHSAENMVVVMHPLYVLTGSALLALVVSVVGIKLAALMGKREGHHFILVVSLVVIAVGAADALNFSVLLTLLIFGILTRNLDKERSLMPVDFGRGGELFIVVLFVVSGARLAFDMTLGVAWMGVVLLVARFIGKFIGVAVFARAGAVGVGGAWNLNLVMQPLSGAVLVSTLGMTQNYPEVGATLAAALMLALTVLELGGPVVAKWGLKRAGEANPAT